jgi:cytoskeleton protein RodZ
MDTADSTRAGARRDDAPGAVLGAAREAHNLSVADVARQLKLSVHQVEALEAGEFHRLPGPVFVRGFIRNYARLVKLDAEALLRSAAGVLPPVEPRPAAPPSQDIPFPAAAPGRWRVPLAALLVVGAALAAYEFYWSDPQPAVTRSAVAPAPVPTAGAESAAPPASPTEPAAKAEAASPEAGTVPAPDATPAPDAAETAPPADAGGAPPHTELQPAPNERQVHMVFAEECWVEIRDSSGRPIFSQLNRPGTEQRIAGRPPLSVIVGNAHGVRLTWDEQPVDLARHTKIDVARLTLQ